VLGLLGLISLVTSVAQPGLSPALIGKIAGGLLLTTVLYLVLFWALSERVPHPWLRTVIFWLPIAFILLPAGWGFGVLLYLFVSLIVAALSSDGGCEVVTVPSLLFRRRCTVYCPLNAIDLIERQSTQRYVEGFNKTP
jgi:hypothetical protein